MKWKDETTYSRGARRREPRCLALALPHGIQLYLHRKIHIPDSWFCSMRWKGQTLFEDQELQETNIERAKQEAMRVGMRLVSGWMTALSAAYHKLLQGLDSDPSDGPGDGLKDGAGDDRAPIPCPE